MEPDPWAVRVPPGYRVAGWEVGAGIATGSWGAVYEARLLDAARFPDGRGGDPGGSGESGLPERAALKFLPTGTLTPRRLSHLTDMARREVSLHEGVEHPRLIRLFGVVTVDDPGLPELDGATVLVMERAERSLADVLRASEGGGPVPDAPRLIAEICEGMAHLHAQGWVHGDLKPGNILLMADGSVRLADFGLAAELEGTHGYMPPAGSSDYVPPERWAESLTERGTAVRTTADVWAFGVTAHQLLTGRPPFPGATARARAAAAAEYAEGHRPLVLDAALSPGWRALLAGCLAPGHAGRTAWDAKTLLARIGELGDPRTAPVRRAGRRGTRSVPVAAVAVAAALLAAAAADAPSPAVPSWAPAVPARALVGAAQWASGPAWTANRRVPPETFGVTMNSSTGTMPSFRVGSVRLWDGGTRWAQLEPARGEFHWSTLDRLVEGAHRAGLPALFVFGGTPAWAAPDGRKGAYPDGSRTAPPDDLADWDALVRAVVTRYRGRLPAYELWVNGNDGHYYSGSVRRLVEMTRRGAAIIREVDPGATVVCPSMGRLWQPEAGDVLRRFAELGGYDHCDAAGVKLHQRRASDPPETMSELLTVIDRAMHRAGVHPPLWSTGTTYQYAIEGALDPRRAVDYLARFYLMGVYGSNIGLRNMYFYAWGNSHLPIVLQPEGGRPTAAALALERLQGWLDGARTRSCGQARTSGSARVWRCRFTLPGGPADIVWTETGTAAVTAEAGALSLHRLDGTAVAVRAGAAVRVTGSPVLIRYSGGRDPGAAGAGRGARP